MGHAHRARCPSSPLSSASVDLKYVFAPDPAVISIPPYAHSSSLDPGLRRPCVAHTRPLYFSLPSAFPAASNFATLLSSTKKNPSRSCTCSSSCADSRRCVQVQSWFRGRPHRSSRRTQPCLWSCPHCKPARRYTPTTPPRPSPFRNLPHLRLSQNSHVCKPPWLNLCAPRSSARRSRSQAGAATTPHCLFAHD